MKVHTLLGKRDFQMALKCLGSLVKMSTENVSLIVHDDGTLTSAEIDTLSHTFPHLTIIERRMADEWAEAHLKSWPNCQSFRRRHILALKLFDVFILSEEDRITFCDSDVLFFRPFHGLQTPLKDSDAIFMRDIVNQLAFRSWDILFHNLRFVSHLNSGLFSIRRSLLDLERLEWFFQFQYPDLLKHFAEQTAWAVACSGLRTSFWNPAQIRIAHPSTHLTDTTVSFHYVGHYRSRLGTDRIVEEPPSKSITLETISSDSVGFVEAGRSELERLGRRLMGKNPYPSAPYQQYGV